MHGEREREREGRRGEGGSERIHACVIILATMFNSAKSNLP